MLFLSYIVQMTKQDRCEQVQKLANFSVIVLHSVNFGEKELENFLSTDKVELIAIR